jgi:periplasmic protein TonB
VFTTLSPGRRRSRFALPASLAAHGAVGSLILLLPLAGPTDQPVVANPPRFFVLPPPPAAAPPLPKGQAEGRTPRKTPSVARVSPVTPPLETPPQITAAPVEEQVLEAPQSGSPDGSETGTTDGMVGGREGGTVGGVPWGVPGGCPGCVGEGPVADWDQAPRILRQSRPPYPQEAFINKIQGTVLLEILIDANGDVVATRVLRSVSPDLDQAATQTVRQWKFAPAHRRGRSVAMWAHAPVEFRIH